MKPSAATRHHRREAKARRRRHRLERDMGRFATYLQRKHRRRRRGGKAPQLRGLRADANPNDLI